jgi:hypothetical protein
VQTPEPPTRYIRVDVPLLTLLQRVYESGINKVLLTYDIACKFGVNLSQRHKENPYSPLAEAHTSKLQDDRHFLMKVPTWHGQSHEVACQDRYSLRHTRLAGLETGEQVETNWARTNHLKYTTREQGAGTRRDTITATLNDINKTKIQRLGELRLL